MVDSFTTLGDDFTAKLTGVSTDVVKGEVDTLLEQTQGKIEMNLKKRLKKLLSKCKKLLRND
jgi:hypothetical protein